MQPLSPPHGIPLILKVVPFGRRIYQKKKCSEQLLARGQSAVQESWLHVADYEKARRVSAVAAECCGWPNDFFIPEDKCCIVFWDDDPGLDSVIAEGQMERVFNLGKKGWFHRDVLGPLYDDGTMGQVVTKMVQIGAFDD